MLQVLTHRAHLRTVLQPMVEAATLQPPVGGGA